MLKPLPTSFPARRGGGEIISEATRQTPGEWALPGGLVFPPAALGQTIYLQSDLEVQPGLGVAQVEVAELRDALQTVAQGVDITNPTPFMIFIILIVVAGIGNRRSG